MNQTPASPWARALTLRERADLLALRPALDAESGFDPELAARRLAAWRREAGLGDEAWRRRLAQQGLDAERFEAILGNPAPWPADRPGERGEPEWLRRLRAAYDGPDDPRSPDWRALGELAERSDAVFLPTVRPLLDLAWRRLHERLAALRMPPSLERFAALWVAPLPKQLLWMVSRTLILELYIRRLEESLEGATPEERFDHFMRSLDRPGSFALLETYPLLGRALSERVRQWLTTGVELAERLRDDLSAIEETFGRGGPLGDLTALRAGLGDRHEDGRTVARLDFASGASIIYKPRSMALDARFQELLVWLNDQGLEPPLRPLVVLDRGGLDRGRWGWVERVEAAPCRSREEVRRFYARQGVNLALLYALEATDFHHENLIAVGEWPVLIDLESLFQPVFDSQEISREDLNPVVSTVLRSGLLPRRAWTNAAAGEDGSDLSGLGAHHGQLTPIRELQKVGTDEMSFVDRMIEYEVGDHLPTLELDGQEADAGEADAGDTIVLWEMSDVIVEAFVATYRLLERLRPRFLEPGGWLDRFADLETRVILRPTGLYARLVHLSYHPDYVQDALLRERLFDKLCLDSERFWFIEGIVPSERDDLHRGDFPRFLSRTDSCDLIDAWGRLLPEPLPLSGLDLARRRFELLSDDDLERQTQLVQLALLSARPLDSFAQTTEVDSAASQRRLVELPAARGGMSADAPIALAERAARRLETLAQRADDWISWFHLRPQGNYQALEPVSFDLYSGLGGIAIFFAWLGRIVDEEGRSDDGAPWQALAVRSLETARDRYARQVEAGTPGPASSLGGYSGLGGWIYTLTHLGALWRDDASLAEELFDEAEAARDRVASLLADDVGLDLIAGSAGCAVALLELHRHRPSQATLAAAVACGDRLLAEAVEVDVAALGGRSILQTSTGESTLAWRLPQVAEQPLTGFAHGAAGMAWALGRLAAVTGARRFADGARGALAFERALYMPERENWPDLREDRRADGGWGDFHAWCHGAPGIGLSRLGLLEVAADVAKDVAADVGAKAEVELDRSILLEEIRAASRSTVARGFGGSQCLCHGDLGNLDLLLGTARALDDGDLRAAAETTTERVVAGIERDGFRCGISSRVDVPGLMLGLAGIGYGLLRAARPDLVPSVLLLETPD